MANLIEYTKQIPFLRPLLTKVKRDVVARAFKHEPSADYPALRPIDVENAKLFADRCSMVEAFRPLLYGKTIAELGVAFGNFSEFLIETLKPDRFFAFDLFILHQIPVAWGRPTKDLFGDLTHKEYYARRFSGCSIPVVVEEGDGSTNLQKYPDKHFDMIYIDAGHDYAAVKKDTETCKQKIKDDGILIYNDYLMFDHCQMFESFAGSWYGIVQAVNHLVVYDGFEIIGFALHQSMYCDIAVRRRAKRADFGPASQGKVSIRPSWPI
ncbi:MAG TPA: class I SAM-dependent methyltransferase [Chthoniobacterales bacterium]